MSTRRKPIANMHQMMRQAQQHSVSDANKRIESQLQAQSLLQIYRIKQLHEKAKAITLSLQYPSNDENRAIANWKQNLILAQQGLVQYQGLTEVYNAFKSLANVDGRDYRDTVHNLLSANADVIPNRAHRALARKAQSILGGQTGAINVVQAKKLFTDITTFFQNKAQSRLRVGR